MSLHKTFGKIALLSYMGVYLGRSHWGRNVGWRGLLIGCWVEYLGVSRMR